MCQRRGSASVRWAAAGGQAASPHLQGLSPGHVVLRLQQLRVAVEEPLVVAVQELGDRRCVPRQQVLQTTVQLSTRGANGYAAVPVEAKRGRLQRTLKVEKASEAISKFWTSVLVMSLKTRSPCSANLQQERHGRTYCDADSVAKTSRAARVHETYSVTRWLRMQSRNRLPQLSAISGLSYLPSGKENLISAPKQQGSSR